MLSPGRQRDKRSSPSTPATYQQLSSQQSLLLAVPDEDHSDKSSISSTGKRVVFGDTPRPASARQNRIGNLQTRLRDARRQSSFSVPLPTPTSPARSTNSKMPTVSVRDPTSVLGLGTKIVFHYLNGPGEGLIPIDTRKNTIVFLHPTVGRLVSFCLSCSH